MNSWGEHADSAMKCYEVLCIIWRLTKRLGVLSPSSPVLVQSRPQGRSAGTFVLGPATILRPRADTLVLENFSYVKTNR